MIKNFLKDIRRLKENQLSTRMVSSPMESMKRASAAAKPPRSFRQALSVRKPAIIAEIKRRSPSAGMIRTIDDPAITASAMVRGGVAAVSVLTEENFFGGSLDDLRLVRDRVDVAILRKDFLINPYELYEARAFGADAVILITAMLDQSELEEMYKEAAFIGLECLVEVHNEQELLRALGTGADIIGINNRDLTTMIVDQENALRLCSLVPAGVLIVGESGYRSREDIITAQDAGINAFLIGESIMKSADIEASIRNLIGAPI